MAAGKLALAVCFEMNHRTACVDLTVVYLVYLFQTLGYAVGFTLDVLGLCRWPSATF